MTAWNLHSLIADRNPCLLAEGIREKIAHFQTEKDLQKAFAIHQEIEAEIQELESYIHCLLSQNVKDNQAKKLHSEFSHLQAAYQTAIVSFDQRLVNENALPKPSEEEQFLVNEKREQAQKRLTLDQEKLIHSLSVNGFKSWEELYHNTVGSLKFSIKRDGKENSYSAAQAYNLLHHADRDFRSHVFTVWENGFSEKKELFAMILNSIAGFRLSTLKLRGKSDFLEEPLDRNRMKRESLDAMWEAVASKKDVLTQFLYDKAKKMGLARLSWHDVEVPSAKGQKLISYEKAQEIIIEKFSNFSQAMGDYAKKAFLEKTIDAEDRLDKLPGGFCTPFPLSKQSRIFMTWSGTRENLLTLAHELGHGFHSELLFDRAPLAQKYPMNLAETASTFAEQLIFEELMKEDRESILEEKTMRSVLFLMNIYARYLFEKEFYEKRSKSFLTADELSELMEKAQKQAFGSCLEFYHPHFWASKQHFYFTSLPFYNFPYTFGYLFSLGLFTMANEKNFQEKYCSLLKDTGSMTAEDLVAKHLGFDLSKPDFWNLAVNESILK